MYTIIGGDGNQYGPVTAEQIQQWLAEGRLNRQSQVQAQGSSDWNPLGSYPQFAGLTLPPPLPRPPAQPDLADSAAMRLVLPVGRSGLAIAAGYLGLFSLVILPAPIALVVGILAIRDIRRSRATDKPKYGLGRAVFGTVMGGLGTLFLLIGLGGALLE